MRCMTVEAIERALPNQLFKALADQMGNIAWASESYMDFNRKHLVIFKIRFKDGIVKQYRPLKQRYICFKTTKYKPRNG